MKKILVVLSILFFCGSVGAVNGAYGSGVEIGVKGGFIPDYNQPRLNLGNAEFENLNLVGGQFYISKLPVIDMIISADYGWNKDAVPVADENFDLRFRDLTVAVSLVYPIDLSFLRFYAGAGLGSHTLAFEYVRPEGLSLSANGIEIPETSTYFGYQAIAGLRTNAKAGSFGLFAEVKFDRVNIPGDDIEYKTVSGGIFFLLP